MDAARLTEFLDCSPCILGEGAVIERLRRNSDLELDPFIVNSAFVHDVTKRAALENIYRQYLDIGQRYNLPLLLSTATWRASRERIEAAGYADVDINGDNFRFLDCLRTRYGDYVKQVVICGLLSCRGDAYKPSEALAVAEAREFHSWQAEKLAQTGVDFLLAATLPALSEATGLAMALAAAGKPYMISFVVRAEGTLLDGTPLKSAIAAVDAAASQRPLAYLVNCTHASIFRTALLHPVNSSSMVRKRVIGLLANTAPLSPEELDNCSGLVTEEPETFGESVSALHGELGMKILGGCCGTDDRHIRCLASHLSQKLST
jgi:S-methylmethionine-dependent homocysteine/selenocysteine methylase